MSQDSQNQSFTKRDESYEKIGNKTEARVLVLYTGGTIGMLRNDKNGEMSIFAIVFHAGLAFENCRSMHFSYKRQNLLIVCLSFQSEAELNMC